MANLEENDDRLYEDLEYEEYDDDDPERDEYELNKINTTVILPHPRNIDTTLFNA